MPLPLIASCSSFFASALRTTMLPGEAAAAPPAEQKDEDEPTEEPIAEAPPTQPVEQEAAAEVEAIEEANVLVHLEPHPSPIVEATPVEVEPEKTIDAPVEAPVGRFLASKADLPRRISAILKWLSVFIVDDAEELLRLVICATAAVSGTVDCGLKLATKIHLWPPITA